MNAAEYGTSSPGVAEVEPAVPGAGEPGDSAGGPALEPKNRLSGGATGFVTRFGLIGAWLLIIVIFGAIDGSKFLSTASFTAIFSDQSTLALGALALLVPLVAGEYDLSVAGTIGISSVVIAVLNVQHGWPIALTIVAAVVVGAFIGLVNAVVIITWQVNSLIATLGMLSVLEGLQLLVSGQVTIPGVSSSFVQAVSGHPLGLTNSFYFAVVVGAIVWYAIEFTPAGRRMRFTGLNRDVSRLAGIRVNRVKCVSLVVSGCLAALAGAVNVGTIGAADPTSAASLLLPIFATVFLGVTVINVGRFNVWGTLIAVFFLTTGFTGLELLGLATWIQQVFYGGVLIAAVAGSQYLSRRSQV